MGDEKRNKEKEEKEKKKKEKNGEIFLNSHNTHKYCLNKI
jgi:hypothetical protein